ncbi:MAG: hypothetical protein DCC75_10325, partial [Proteobacteria bacterium]
MQEPKPENLKASAAPPTIKVGLVLPEDNRSVLKLRALEAVSVCGGAGKLPISLAPQSEVEVAVVGGEVELNAGGQKLRDREIRLSPEKQHRLTPQSGIEVHDVIAGRKFHWRKEVALSFPGTLLITAENRHLVAVNEVSFEDYVTCVISSEMGPGCPKEFLMAQAVAARCWAWVFLRNKHRHPLFSVCNDDDCQRYQGTSHLKPAVIEASRGCAGEFLISDAGFVTPAYYSKSCGGFTESARYAFGFEVLGMQPVFDAPGAFAADLSSNEVFASFLRGTECNHCYCSEASVPAAELPNYLGAVDEHLHYFRWRKSIRQTALEARLKEKLHLSDLSEVVNIAPLKRGRSGRIYSLAINYMTHANKNMRRVIDGQYQIRELLDESFLLSSAFVVTRDSQGSFVLDGAGWGHGVGLCQIGAVAMALRGKGYK